MLYSHYNTYVVSHSRPPDPHGPGTTCVRQAWRRREALAGCARPRRETRDTLARPGHCRRTETRVGVSKPGSAGDALLAPHQTGPSAASGHLGSGPSVGRTDVPLDSASPSCQAWAEAADYVGERPWREASAALAIRAAETERGPWGCRFEGLRELLPAEPRKALAVRCCGVAQTGDRLRPHDAAWPGRGDGAAAVSVRWPERASLASIGERPACIQRNKRRNPPQF